MSETIAVQGTAIGEVRTATVDEDAKVRVEFLSAKGNVFTADNQVFKGGIDMVILQGKKVRSWFSGPYVDGVEAFPDCFSVGNKFPSKNSPKPQAADCESCPKAQWQGKEAPECKERRKLVGLRVKDGKINPTLSVVSVFPTSVSGTKAHPGGYRGYLSKLNLGQEKAKETVITHIDIESNAPKPGARMEFTNIGDVSSLGVNPGVLAGFMSMATEEANMEPKPKEDEEGTDDVKAKAEANLPKPAVKTKPKF
jgi:hypothetical protein